MKQKRALLFLAVSTIGLTCSTALAFAFTATTTTTTTTTVTPCALQQKQQQQQQRCTTYNTAKGSALYGSDMEYDSSSISSNNNDLLLVREFLQKNSPVFLSILDKNAEVWKAIGSEDDVDTEVGGFTLFLPSAEALEALGETKQNQLLDERNQETTEKIAGYHVIGGEAISAEALFEAGGVMTVAGEVPIERSVSGGFFGVGGKEDGGVTLNQAKVTRTAYVGSGVVHEVDNLVSPNILWRYMDQLRIPGST